MANTTVRRPSRLQSDGRERFILYPRHVNGRCIVAMGLNDGRVLLSSARLVRENCVHQWIVNDGEVTWSHMFAAVPAPRAKRALRSAVSSLSKEASRVRKSLTFEGAERGQVLKHVRSALARS